MFGDGKEVKSLFTERESWEKQLSQGMLSTRKR